MFGTPAGANVPEIKAELNTEMQALETTQLLMTAPLLYGCAPALLWYFKPLGPFENPADILPQGKIKESCEALEGAADVLTDDLVYLGKKAASVGADGFNFDTTAASGDAEFYGVLNAVQKLKEAVPELGIEVGMAAEFVLGLHGKVTFNGQRLAGLYPHDQVKVAEGAGVDVFGPVVNTNCSRSFPWNISRTVTFVKETSAVSSISIHPNVGMGVGGVPMYPVPPIDCVTRVAKAIIQIGKADGL
jgi:dimethylamine--corrinoid protein Co-methyltransferase